MSTANELHNEAMDLAARGFREQRYGHDEESLYFFQQALASECAAIDAMAEPSSRLTPCCIVAQQR